MPKKLHTYKVWYSNHSSCKARAYSLQGAREQAWEALGGFKFGWTKKDFMKNSSVDKLFN